jgi:hypothetical protein
MSKKGLKKKLKETLEYIGEASLMLMYNGDRKNLEEYGDNSIIKESHMTEMQFDISRPNCYHG